MRLDSRKFRNGCQIVSGGAEAIDRGLLLEEIPVALNRDALPRDAGIHIFPAIEQARRGWPGRARPRRVGDLIRVPS